MRFLFALLLATLPLAGQGKGPYRLEWKLARDSVAEYSFLDPRGKPIPDRSFRLLGTELAKNTNRLAVDTCAGLPFPLLFQLPPNEVKGPAAWDFTQYFFHEAADARGQWGFLGGGGAVKPLCARGRYTLKSIQKKGDDEIALVDGAFTLYEIRWENVNNQSRLTVTKNDLGTLATSTQFSVTRGLVVKAGYHLKLRGQERVADGQGGTRVMDKQITAQELIEFKEEVALDPEKSKASVEMALKKAVDWLRKKQQPTGSWGTARSLESGRATADVTGLVVRALLAAGVKSDDSAILASAKTLRPTLPASTQTSSHAIVALAQKGPSAAETTAIKEIAASLLQRRDPKSGGWSTGDRNAAINPISTGYAIEALHYAADVKVPDEAWKAAFELLVGALVDDLAEVDLDVEFEKDLAPIAADPKKVTAAFWPFDINPRPTADLMARAPRGCPTLNTVFAIKALLILSERVQLDAAQRKKLDAALRKGLAYLQAFWSLRLVPPTEAAWCRQRNEYLGLLSHVLAVTKVVRVSGSDWRAEGTYLLLKDQLADGSWDSGLEQPVLETASALLFLTSLPRAP